MWAFPVCFASVVSVIFQSMHLTEVGMKHYNLPLPFSSPLPAHTHTLKLSQRPLQLSLPKRFVLAPSPLQGCYRVSFAVRPHPLPRPLLLINGRAWVVLYPPLAATVLETLHYEEAPLFLPWARTYSQPWLRLEKGVSGSSDGIWSNHAYCMHSSFLGVERVSCCGKGLGCYTNRLRV